MNQSIAIPALAAFFVTLILGPGLIKFLHRLKFGQFIREEGPESHLKKSGTPTMGGILFLIGILVGSVFYISDYPKIVPVLFVTLGFGLIGFLDDYIKVVMKRNLGLTPAQKMLGQIFITAVFAFYMVNYSGLGTEVIIPFTGGTMIDLGILYVPILFFVVLGTVNGANFTDGLDGLASSVTTLIAVFFTVIAVAARTDVHPVACAVIGALLGFLCFNTHPAKVFMGDTGSLALGGFVVSTAYMLQIPFFLPIVAFIYFVEVLSVIIQVAYYKRTKKRIFKMAPIHHHFELSGWPETKVVSIFSIVTAVLCLIGMLAY
ncbi:MAG TPA: phospho-N-acetylmuramoyl-pentapeptide-transferase [Candidatus Anaerobutyricum stercoris]|uniref:Phospho-N-acetylmuramoyl-pentapeptide-transferase n=1 Tax=Candidatus Anaerobutyricum stercoris TaxID=2838457 RepID=A0A9D2ENG1_9FIRM|nr:phospho-N-acetylmuramoyl-pentapeptide-transferase [Eubacterium sp. An3]OUO25154.1 phospho-N-acetylmuramoyl-pentapeptide-transferase [Eubacterium sp. An3]CVI71961.1 Phospho-N-acetylmuramoyl-pentapeptide-transferase [Eubacteriaceae bacterium CHKCI004]HIZ40894.1 phospho-N-acetylmuramoyl-pentapeptide-transferase [Candidatus Anaerobutyricum stercoris]